MKKYLLYMVQVHLNFRKAELESLADLYNLSIDFSQYDVDSPFFVVELENDQQAKDWIKRSILTRGIYEYWGQGATLDELHQDIKRQSNFEQDLQEKFKHSTFKFEFECYKGNSKANRIKQIESFRYLDFEGKIDMKHPQEVFTVVEEYTPVSENIGGKTPTRIFIWEADTNE